MSEETVQVGTQFTVSLPVQVENRALGAFKSYFDQLIASRPVPDGYILESYKIDTEKGVVEIVGRVIEPGEHTLFLGTFVWESTMLNLPSIKINAQPISGTSLSAKNMLLPYPTLAFHESDENRILKNDLFASYFQAGASKVRQQKNFKRSILLFLGLLCLTPVFLVTVGRKIEEVKLEKKQISFAEELALARQSKDWTKLLALLQRLSGKKEFMTSYELSEWFLKIGKKDLEKAAIFVEKYGYLTEKAPDRFDEAADSILMEVKK